MFVINLENIHKQFYKNCKSITLLAIANYC